MIKQQYILKIETDVGVNIDLELAIRKALANYGHFSCKVFLEEHSGKNIDIIAVKKEEQN